MKRTTLYQKTKITSKIQQWDIWVVEKGKSGYPEVHTEYGHTEGKKQTTFDVVKEGVNEGKANATTPLQQAYLVLERKVTKQREQGYTDTLEGTEKSVEIDWTKPFPKELCFYKPQNSIEVEKLDALDKQGKSVYTVKRNGMCHIACQNDVGPTFYSRRMDVETYKYPHLMESLKNLPPQTVLLGELVLVVDGKDSLNAVSKICRCKPAEAILRQEAVGKVQYVVYDLAFLKGKNLLTTLPYKERRAQMLDVVKALKSKHIEASEVISKPHLKALEEAVDRKLEGLVVWDASGVIKDGRAFTFNGKPVRPSAVSKYKPKYRDDFIARWNPANSIGDYGKGKNKDRIGQAFLYQLLDGKEVFISKCGGGLTDANRELYTNVDLFPRVWEVEYSSIQPGTGSLQHPEFKEDRTTLGDKDLDECEMSSEIKAAREAEIEEDEE
jgi:hypothetical protein